MCLSPSGTLFPVFLDWQLRACVRVCACVYACSLTDLARVPGVPWSARALEGAQSGVPARASVPARVVPTRVRCVPQQQGNVSEAVLTLVTASAFSVVDGNFFLMTSKNSLDQF